MTSKKLVRGGTLIDSMFPPNLAADLEEYAAKFDANGDYYRPRNWNERMNVPLDLIVAGRWQPRSVFADAAINELAESIGQHGIINPLLVFANEHGKLELIAGERRLRAAKLAALEEVPVTLVEGPAALMHELSIVDNLQRADLQPHEEGRAIQRMSVELGLSDVALAKRLGKSRAYVQQRKALAAACDELIAAMESRQIMLSVARGIIDGSRGSHEVQRAALAGLSPHASESSARSHTESKYQAIVLKRYEEAGYYVYPSYPPLIAHDGLKPTEINPLTISLDTSIERVTTSTTKLEIHENRLYYRTNRGPWVAFYRRENPSNDERNWLHVDSPELQNHIAALAAEEHAEFARLNDLATTKGYTLAIDHWGQGKAEANGTGVYLGHNLIAIAAKLEALAPAAAPAPSESEDAAAVIAKLTGDPAPAAPRRYQWLETIRTDERLRIEWALHQWAESLGYQGMDLVDLIDLVEEQYAAHDLD